MHPNLGILLDERKIKEPSDFLTLPRGDKISFLKHIRSTISARKEDLLHELSGTAGLRMHFHVSRHPRKGWQNLPNPTFARKIAFFSAKTVISFPFEEVNPSAGEDLTALISLLCAIRPYLRAGLVELVESSNDIRGVQAHRFNDKHGLVAANFELADLERQFEEPEYKAQVINLYLPYFRGLSPSQVISLRQREQSQYRKLEMALDNLLHGKTQIESERSLLSTLRDIDEHVNHLEIKYKAIQRAEARKDVYTLIGFIGIGLLAAHFPPALWAALFDPTGKANVLSYISRKVANDAYDILDEDRYYLLWKFHHREPLLRLA